MKHTTGPRRGRPRGNGKRFSSGKTNNIESNGPDVKIRGTAQQVCDKYMSLARDAWVSGDRITAEGYFQYADHYYRVVSAANGNAVNRQPERDNRIPPPPDQNAGKIVLENGDGAEGGSANSAKPTDQAAGNAGNRQHGQPKVIDVPIVDAGSEAAAVPAPVAEAQPANAQSGGRGATGRGARRSGSQAEELAHALAKADTDTDEITPATDAAEAVEAVAAPASDSETGEPTQKRRRRSPLGIGPKRSPRRRPQQTAAEGSNDAGAVTEGPAKTIRRRSRKLTADPADNATGNS